MHNQVGLVHYKMQKKQHKFTVQNFKIDYLMIYVFKFAFCSKVHLQPKKNVPFCSPYANLYFVDLLQMPKSAKILKFESGPKS